MKNFFQNLDNDIRDSLLKQLKTLWTHTSTAIEGNTLTLGETDFILNEGLTVSGKPLKDHKEVEGHAKAIDIIYTLLDKKNITEKDLFLLHKALQTEITVDIYQPTGTWKVENNGTYHIDKDNNQVFINYAEPDAVPALMDKWLDMLNNTKDNLTKNEASRIYSELHISFVSIHPFADGNGRMARLLANIPVLRAGYPPIIISREKRYDYIQLISRYQLTAPSPTPNNLITGNISKFEEFIINEWEKSQKLIENAYKEQEKRNEKS